MVVTDTAIIIGHPEGLEPPTYAFEVRRPNAHVAHTDA